MVDLFRASRVAELGESEALLSVAFLPLAARVAKLLAVRQAVAVRVGRAQCGRPLEASVHEGDAERIARVAAAAPFVPQAAAQNAGLDAARRVAVGNGMLELREGGARKRENRENDDDGKMHVAFGNWVDRVQKN